MKKIIATYGAIETIGGRCKWKNYFVLVVVLKFRRQIKMLQDLLPQSALEKGLETGQLYSNVVSVCVITMKSPCQYLR